MGIIEYLSLEICIDIYGLIILYMQELIKSLKMRKSAPSVIFGDEAITSSAIAKLYIELMHNSEIKAFCARNTVSA